MVTKAKIKGLDFNNLYEYFEYIVNSKINGNIKQTIDLFFDLSANQKLDFYQFLIDNKIDLVEFLDYVKNIK